MVKLWRIPTTSPRTTSRVPSCTQSCLWVRSPLELRMAQNSDDPLFVVSVVVWVFVVILAIVAFHCPLPRIVVR
ncbi:hypothetical protein PAHAL_2G251300 [Panicum hallii]|uniref:Uncharacterized protein n=1 Tax=Panicum hallii TaxID=206008 RepID=A0A2T8KQA5_9POAL|nr:hypothetical protein PAHAL_2G251300 [Panicum hallii]